MISEKGCSDWGEAQGQFTWGESANKRIYLCSDRWIYIEATEDLVKSLVEIVTGKHCVEKQQIDQQTLESAFIQKPSEHWRLKLEAVGIACHVVITGDDISSQIQKEVGNDATNEAATGSAEFYVRNEHPCGSPIVSIAPSWVRVGKNHSYRRLTPAPKYGENTREILSTLGYSSEEIEDLIHEKVSHEYLPPMGSKNKYFF